MRNINQEVRVSKLKLVKFGNDKDYKDNNDLISKIKKKTLLIFFLNKNSNNKRGVNR